MTFDPTTNRIQFVLLTEDEQAALKTWPHGWEYYSRWPRCWDLCISPEWAKEAVYRGLSKPVVTSVWLNVYPHSVFCDSHLSREKADDAADPPRIAVLRIDTCNSVSTAHLEDV